MKNLILYVASAMLLLTACDALDITPSDSYSDPVVWQDQNLIKMFVNDQYDALIGQDNFYRYSFFSDEVYQKYNDEGCNFVRENILTSDNVGSVTDILNYWKTGYKFIHNVNTFFTNIETASVDEDFKKTMIGEMKFVRAFIYFRLIRSYGGVPILEEVYDINSNWSDVKRNTYDQCVDYIIKNLDEVIATLPDRPKERNRISANAARALKSRVLLYSASALNNPDNNKDKWQKAADAAKDLFDKGYSLSDNYREMFLDVANSEYIFAKEFNETYSHMLGFNFACTGDGGRGWSTPSQNLVDAYETLEGEIPVLNSKTGEVNPKATYDPENPYEKRDPRFYDCIYYNGSTTVNDRIVETFQGGADMLNQDMTMTGYYCRKFLNEAEPVSQSHHYTTPFPLFRLAEIYLNYAEAEYHLGNEDIAREYVNKVRARKSVSMPAITEGGEALLQRIYHERQIELAFEGHRYFDLRRWKIADNEPIIGFKITKDSNNNLTYERYTLSLASRESEWKDAFFVLPIHYQEVQKSNNSLEQNPGY